MKKRNIVITLVIVPMVLTVLVAIGYFGVSKRSVSNEERELLVAVGDLRPFFPDLPPTGGVFIAKRNLDGTVELEYEFDSEEMWIKSEAEIFSSVPLAQEGFKHRVQAYHIGAKASRNMTIVQDEDLFDAGGDNFAAFFQNGDRKFGNVIVTRQDKTVFALLLMSAYLDNKDDLTEILVPKLKKAEESNN